MPLYLFRCSANDGDHSRTWGTNLPDVEAALTMAVAEAKRFTTIWDVPTMPVVFASKLKLAKRPETLRYRLEYPPFCRGIRRRYAANQRRPCP